MPGRRDHSPKEGLKEQKGPQERTPQLAKERGPEQQSTDKEQPSLLGVLPWGHLSSCGSC